MSNIIVTGGAGFIGSHLTDKLIGLGHNVWVIDNLSTGSSTNVNNGAVFFNVDVSDRDRLERKLKKLSVYRNGEFDFVFHLAAQINLRESFKNPAKDAKVNIVGGINAINIAKEQGAKFIFASTGGALYSETQNVPPWYTWAKIDPKSPYGIAKHTVERYLKVLGVKHIILRLSNVYGPRQNHKGEAGVVSIFINNILDNKDLTIFGDGNQTRDFIYVDDVVDAFVRSMSLHPHDNNRAYNISTGIGTDITTIAHMIIGEMWANRNVVYAGAITGELKDSVLNYNLPDWSPKVSLDDGIKRTVKYFSDI